MTRILIVDDDRELLKLMEGVFAHRGYITETADHGLGVIHRLVGDVVPNHLDPFDPTPIPAPDICVLDNYLPEISGIAIVNLAVRTRGATDVPIVLYSSDPSVEADVLKSGHPRCFFLLKGSILKLADCVDALLHRPLRP